MAKQVKKVQKDTFVQQTLTQMDFFETMKNTTTIDTSDAPDAKRRKIVSPDRREGEKNEEEEEESEEEEEEESSERTIARTLVPSFEDANNGTLCCYKKMTKVTFPPTTSR